MTRLEIPLDEALVDRLEPFWASIFGEPGDLDRSFFLGDETDWCDTTLYMEDDDGRPVATCLTVRSKAIPHLAGFAEVATEPAYRGKGFASTLCRQAVDDFRGAGGEILFLGTGNPAAARIYDRLGWRKLAGANVMASVTSSASPEAFLVEMFSTPGSVTVGAAEHDVRISMIPLIWTPHDDQVLDANVGLYSRRYVVQHSCMGLYPRYTRTLEGCGAWFAARTEGGRVVGLSSGKVDGEGGCQVDGFAHGLFAPCWEDLIKAASAWGRSVGCGQTTAVVSVEDERKRQRFELLGFEQSHERAGHFDLGGRAVSGIVLTRAS